MKKPSIAEFVTVVESGSFTAAAESIGTSKSRLSQQISELENQLGVQLLHRSTRSLRLTEVGEEFFERCRRGLNILDDAMLDAQKNQHDLRGKLRINSVGGVIGEQVVAAAIVEFMRLNPNIEVELDFGSRHANVIEEQYDAVFRMGKLKDSTLIARPLVSYRSYVCASPDFVARHGMPETPKDLAKLPWVVGSLGKFSMSKDGSSEEHVVSHDLKCRNGYVMKLAAIQGLGVCRLPDIYLESAVAGGELVELLPDWRASTHDLAIVYPRYRYKLKRINALVTFIVDYFAERNG